MKDGQHFVIFRQVVVKPRGSQKVEPGAAFCVQSHVARMSPTQNKLFSLLPIPLFIGLPGFRSKLWLLNEANGNFMGMYEWDTLQDAENYAHSFALKFMTKRSVPGTVSYRITPSVGST